MATMQEMSEQLCERLWDGLADYMNREPDDLDEESFQTAAKVLGESVEVIKHGVRMGKTMPCPEWSELDERSRFIWKYFVIEKLMPSVAEMLAVVHRNHLQGRN